MIGENVILLTEIGQTPRRRRVEIVFPLVGRTKPEFQKDADIKNILKRYEKTGQVPGNPRVPLTGDFSSVPDFQAAMELIARAKEQFESLPAEIRSRFANDPTVFLDFMSKEENKEEAIKLGILAKPVIAQRIEEVVSPLGVLERFAVSTRDGVEFHRVKIVPGV